MKWSNFYKGDRTYQVLLFGTYAAALLSCIFLHNTYLTFAFILASVIVNMISRRKLANSLKRFDRSEESSLNLESLYNEVEGLRKGIVEAATSITELGNEGERKFEVLKEEDQLAVAIVAVDKKLKAFNSEEKKRNWGVEGLAKFGEILRTHDADIKDLSKSVISNLVQYINANQGGIFLLKKAEDGEEFLELTACYAYGKERIRENRIDIGQGLLGQCVLERDTLFLTDIPQDYVRITSGLGEATPTCLAVVPLMVNESIYGVFELAAFHPFEKHEIRFLEQVAENIASVFASLSNNERTKKLLDDSVAMTSELQSREEEMRQNMEELTATQEEMSRNQAELDGVFKAINHTMGVAELDINGLITSSNDSLQTILGMSKDDMIGRDFTMLTGPQNKEKFLRSLYNGETISDEYLTKRKNSDELWVSASFSPMIDNKGVTYKILAMITDITARKLEEIEFEKLSLVADNTDNSVVITDAKGHIEYVNHGFCAMTGYNEDEVLGRKPGDFLQGPETNKETIERVRDGILKKVPVYEEILNYTKTGTTYWISMAINPVINDEGNVEKYISIQANITETKKNALDFKYKLEAISKSNAIIEFDTKGNVLDANDNFLKIVGYNLDEIAGQHHSLLVTEELKNSEEYQAFWAQLSKGTFVEGEFERQKKDGSKIWLRGMYNPIYDMNGVPCKIVKFAVDITQEKVLKEEAERNEIDLKNHMEAIYKTIASVEFDMKGVVTGANSIYLSITGFSEEKLVGMKYLDLIPEAEKDKPQTTLMWENLKDGQFFNGEFKLRDIDGKELWLTGTFNPIKDMNGQPYKIMMFAQFNTSEKEKQKDLGGTVAALKNTTPIMELNADGTFKNANDLFFTQFGYKRLELRRRPFLEFIKGRNMSAEISEIMNKLEEHQFAENDLTIVDASGNLKVYRTTFTPIFNLEEKLTKIVVIMIDREVVMKLM